MDKLPAILVAVAVALVLIVGFGFLPFLVQHFVGAACFGWCAGGVAGRIGKGLHHG